MGIDRQVWIEGAQRWCSHAKMEVVRSADDTKVYGERCRLCSVVWAIGLCDGCADPGARLTIATEVGRFCNDGCLDAARKRRIAEQRERVRLNPSERKARYRCPHKRTSDVKAEDGTTLALLCLDCSKPVRAMGRK